MVTVFIAFLYLYASKFSLVPVVTLTPIETKLLLTAITMALTAKIWYYDPPREINKWLALSGQLAGIAIAAYVYNF